MKWRVMVFLFLTGMVSPCLTFAGDHKGSKAMPLVTNETYKKNCGACHFAYQPGLLPARSWIKIIDSSGGHPGGELSLDKKDQSEIRTYLEKNSAERGASKRSKKILASIGSDAPIRISETPYIKEKHREIKQEVFLRKAVGSRANCVACHRSAANGVYEDDDVIIPN